MSGLPTLSPESPLRGRLVLVVGPSGVGKDTLIEGARAALADNPDVLFARREITRPADAGGENHVAISDEDFKVRQASGGYLLAWRAHGLAYGLPVGLAAELAAGRIVVANVSRTVLDEARASLPRVRIVSVVAEPARVAARLAARGRERPGDVAARMARADQLPVTGDDVVELHNDGTPDEGARKLVSAILSYD